jgi:hypothetical protein
VGEEALERLWRVVTPIEAAGRRGTQRGRHSTAAVIWRRRTPGRVRRIGRWRGRWGRRGTRGEGEACDGGGLPGGRLAPGSARRRTGRRHQVSVCRHSGLREVFCFVVKRAHADGTVGGLKRWPSLGRSLQGMERAVL